MEKLFAVAIPILPGKTPQWRKFMDDLNGKYYNSFQESRKKLNVHERSFFQNTPQGDFEVVTLEGNDPLTAFKNFAKEKNTFTDWFTKEVQEIHGFDLNSPPQGPLPELIADSKSTVLQN